MMKGCDAHRVATGLFLVISIVLFVASSPVQAAGGESKLPARTQAVESGKLGTTNDIRRVDFKNFTYQLSKRTQREMKVGKSVKVRNGKFKSGDVSFSVLRELYADLTGDGMDEAVVIVGWGFEGANWGATDLHVFTFKGNLVQLAVIDEDDTERDYHKWYAENKKTFEGFV